MTQLINSITEFLLSSIPNGHAFNQRQTLRKAHREPRKAYLFMTEKLLHASRGSLEEGLAAMDLDDLKSIGTGLMEATEQITDQVQRSQTATPTKTFLAPTMVLNYRVTDEGLRVSMGLLNRIHQFPNAIIDRRTFWVPLDILCGTGTDMNDGVCTPDEIVEFLRGKRWEQILASKLSVISTVYDTYAHHANQSGYRAGMAVQIRSSPDSDVQLNGSFPHNHEVINALCPLINRVIAELAK